MGGGGNEKARTAIVDVLTVLQTQNLEPNRTNLSLPKNLLKENILVALSDLIVFDFIVGSLGSAVLVNRHPNLVYSLFGLAITYSSEEFDIRTLIAVMLLWVFYTKMRVFHAAVNHANETESGSKADPAEHLAHSVWV